MGLVQAISTSLGKGGLPPIEVQPHDRTDRSSSIPLSQSMTMADHPIIVQPGCKTRPLRDGGGKTISWTTPTAVAFHLQSWRPLQRHVLRMSNNPSTEGTGTIP
jgi:hypothetical protein